MNPEVFILGGGLISLGVSRSLGRRRIPVTVFGADPNDICFQSRYVRRANWPEEGGRVGPSNSAAVIHQMVAEARALPTKPVLFVSGDDGLLSACRHAEELRPWMDFRLPDLGTARTVLDKEIFQRFAADNDIPVPRGWAPETRTDLLGVMGEMRFPVIIKPTDSMDWHRDSVVEDQGWIKMIRVDDEASLLNQWDRLHRYGRPLLIQEYIRGGDDQHYSYVAYLGDREQQLTSLLCRKLRIHPIGAGLGSFAESAVDPDLEAVGRNVVKRLGYTGAVSVCMKKDRVSGEAIVFEVNGRLPLAHGIFQAVGIDLPWLMYIDAQGLPTPRGTQPRARVRWSALGHDIGSYRQNSQAGRLSFARWLRSYAGRTWICELDPRDPRPFVFFVAQLIRRAVRRTRPGRER